MPRTQFMRALSVLAVAVVPAILAACGSGGGGTIAKQAQSAAPSVVSKAESTIASLTSSSSGPTTSDPTTADPTTSDSSSTTSTTQPTKTTTERTTTTVTSTAKPSTVTSTNTESTHTASITSQTTKINVSPTSTTGKGSSSGLPWWGWLLIGLGIAAVVVGIFQFGRKKGRRAAALRRAAAV
jgi:cobalamin biosynthesis Mg chelatase CobN